MLGNILGSPFAFLKELFAAAITEREEVVLMGADLEFEELEYVCFKRVDLFLEGVLLEAAYLTLGGLFLESVYPD